MKINVKNLLEPVPKYPGVYLFKDAWENIIYIGKAKNLRKRVQSYFRKTEKSVKTKVLVKNIVAVDFIVVNSEVEALLLENKLIKKHKPKYNINLKDAKTFAYITLTDHKYPRIHSTRKVTKKETYFGPYTDSSTRHELVQLAVTMYKLRVCRTMPKRACLNYHINLCSAPCIGAVSEQEYSKQVNAAKNFLKGDAKAVLKNLNKEMKEASKKIRYEVALEKKRKIEAIKYLYEKQTVDLIKRFDQDVIAMKHDGVKAVIVLFSIHKGVISGKKEFTFDYDENVFENFITQYYSTQKVPNEIIVSEKFWQDTRDKKVLEQYLIKLKGMKVVLTVPQRGEKVSLVGLALKNATFEFDNTILKQIQEALNVPTLPRVIECFDISNLGYDYIVGAMTRWVNGKPDTAGNRRFEIKSVRGKQDDFASMREVILRRYRRLRDNALGFPDLILIDGGPGQLNSALESLSELGLQIPIISLAKREEEIYLPGKSEPLVFDKKSAMMLHLRKMRDSVHKYVLAYNRKKRQMRLREQVRI